MEKSPSTLSTRREKVWERKAEVLRPLEGPMPFAHAIQCKIGAGLPVNAILRARVFTGEVWDESNKQQYKYKDQDLVLSRILWLSGLEQSNRNSHQRYIYIHGTNHTEFIGLPASHGCIRMGSSDILTLYKLPPYNGVAKLYFYMKYQPIIGIPTLMHSAKNHCRNNITEKGHLYPLKVNILSFSLALTPLKGGSLHSLRANRIGHSRSHFLALNGFFPLRHVL